MHRLQRDNRLSSPGHFIGMKWQDGWWFIQILGTSVLELKPWTLLNENGNRQAISATTSGNQDEVQDENSNLLLEPNDEERDVIHQILIGVEPSRMQIFPFFGREQNLGLETVLQLGEDELWLDGFASPYDNPTRQSEVFYVNDMSRLKLQAHNPMDTADESKLSFHINRIHYATVTDVNMMKAMLQGQLASRKVMMGLGATQVDQLQIPEWLENAFGEHIKSTQTILSEGNAQQATGAGSPLQVRQSADLEGAERQ